MCVSSPGAMARGILLGDGNLFGEAKLNCWGTKLLVLSWGAALPCLGCAALGTVMFAAVSKCCTKLVLWASSAFPPTTGMRLPDLSV